MRGLGYPMYVNGKLFNEPVTISHVPGMPVGAVDPSMGALGQYVAYAPTLPPLGLGTTVEVLPGASRASLPPPPPPPVPASSGNGSNTFLNIWRYVAPVSSLACAYHGYKRNNSVLWALWWGLVGSMPITPIIAVAQGFGKRKGMTPNRSRARRGAKKTKRRARKSIRRGTWVHTPFGTGEVIETRGTRGDVRVAFSQGDRWIERSRVKSAPRQY